MTLLDDVAKAIDPPAFKQVGASAEPWKAQARAEARAAIAVFARYLREPSEETLRAASLIVGLAAADKVLSALASQIEGEGK